MPKAVDIVAVIDDDPLILRSTSWLEGAMCALAHADNALARDSKTCAATPPI